MVELKYSDGAFLFSLAPEETVLPIWAQRFGRVAIDQRAGFMDWYPANLRGIEGFLGKYGKDAFLSEKAKERYDEIRKEKEDMESGKYVGIYNDGFTVAPYNHQKVAIEMFQAYSKLALLLEPGMGKTFISLNSIRIFKERGLPHRSIVVCPKIVFASWLEEAEKYVPSLKILPYLGNAQERKDARNRIMVEKPDIVLTTYDMLTVVPKKRKPNRVDVLEAYSRLSKEELERLPNVFTQPMKKSELVKTLLTYSAFLPGLNEVMEEDHTVKFLKSVGASVLVVDEASRVIHGESQRSMSMENLSGIMRRVYLLSGTLCTGTPADLFSPMNIMDQSIFNMSWWSFKKRFCLTQKFNNYDVVVGYRNIDKIKEIVEPYVHEGKRADCIDLPERTFVNRYYDLPASSRKLYNEIVSNDEADVDGDPLQCWLPIQKLEKCRQVLSGFVNIDGPGCSKLCKDCNAQQVYLCVTCGIFPGSRKCVKDLGGKVIHGELRSLESPKIAMLSELLDDIVAREKVIIWAHYRYDLKAISDLLVSKKLKYVTASDNLCAQKFESDANTRVFLGQISQGIGITLNSATSMVYYSHGMSLEPRLQSLDRNYRIGQVNRVMVYDFICPGSVEEKVVSLLRHKQEVMTFMQTRIACFDCKKFHSCLDVRTEIFKDGCVFQDVKSRAEMKTTIKLEEI